MKEKVLVIGLGVSGRSAARLLLQKGFSVVGIDRNSSLLEKNVETAELQKKGAILLHESSLLDVSSFSFAVLSPGISFLHPLVHHLLSQKIEVIGEIELACRFLDPSTTLLGITGTNGKTTVTLMVEHILKQAGKQAKAVGNIGIPLTQEVEDSKETILVCELSSYQIETLQSAVFDKAVILNITPDHLDRYKTMEAYAQAKIQIKEFLKSEGVLYIHPRIQEEYPHLFSSFLSKDKKKVELFIPENYKDSLTLDEENEYAAYALCSQLGVSQAFFNTAVKTFKKPPHRIEYVRTFKGIRYFNDSKGTNLHAVIRAVESMQGKVVLIVGGRSKGSSYRVWRDPFREKVKGIVAIGEAKEEIQKDLQESFPIILKETLKCAIECASSLAEDGDNVLFSPGCSSFDMFKNFEERGDVFKIIVDLLHN